MRICIYTYIHTYVRTYIHTYSEYVFAYIYTCIYLYTHISDLGYDITCISYILQMDFKFYFLERASKVAHVISASRGDEGADEGLPCCLGGRVQGGGGYWGTLGSLAEY